MKKENDEITELFHSRLENAELTPRDNFWNSLQNDIPFAIRRHRRLVLYRSIAAASVALVLGATAAVYLIHDNGETKSTPTIAKARPIQIEATKPANPDLNKSIAKADIKETPASVVTSVRNHFVSKANKNVKADKAALDDDSTVTVTVHMSISVRDNGDYANNQSNNNGIYNTGGFVNNQQQSNNNDSQNIAAIPTGKLKTWSLKGAFNVSMPADGSFEAPTGASLTIEKQLNNYLALESGLAYTYLHSKEGTQHYLSIPLKANLKLTHSSNVDLYATAGGSADKCISTTIGSNNESIQFTALAGLGIRYRINKAIALYAEPAYVHYFQNNAKYISYRTENPNAFNFKCGLCMNY